MCNIACQFLLFMRHILSSDLNALFDTNAIFVNKNRNTFGGLIIYLLMTCHLSPLLSCGLLMQTQTCGQNSTVQRDLMWKNREKAILCFCCRWCRKISCLSRISNRKFNSSPRIILSMKILISSYYSALQTLEYFCDSVGGTTFGRKLVWVKNISFPRDRILSWGIRGCTNPDSIIYFFEVLNSYVKCFSQNAPIPSITDEGFTSGIQSLQK